VTSPDQHAAVEAARVRADLSVQQLWLRYLALGGSSDAFDVDGYLQGLVPLPGFQADVLAQAVNEALEELFRSLRVPLSALPVDDAPGGTLQDIIRQLLGLGPLPPGTAAPPSGNGGAPPAPPPVPLP